MSSSSRGFAEDSIPASWTTATLAEIAEFNPRLPATELSDAHPVRFVPMGAVDEECGGIQRDEVRSYADVKKGYTPFQTGDVIFAKITPCMENGKFAVARGESTDIFFGSTEFHVLRPRLGVDSRWILRFLSQDQIRRKARMNMTGSVGQLRVPRRWLESLSIPLAPAEEQGRVLDRVDELLSDLHSGQLMLEGVQSKLERYRSAVLFAAVSGRLTASWREANSGGSDEAARRLLDAALSARKDHPKGNRRDPSPPNLSGLPEIPGSWCWASLDQLADLTGGLTKNQANAKAVGRRQVPYLRVANVQRGRIDLSEVKEIAATEEDVQDLRLMPGDVLFTEGGDRDKLGRGWVWKGELPECIHQNHIFRARLFSLGVLPEYVSCCGNSYGQVWFKTFGKQSVNLASVSLSVLRTFPVALPPAAEQVQIMQEVGSHLSLIENLSAVIERALRRGQRLNQSILKCAFSGTLVPQDTGDEPASELLARLRQPTASSNDGAVRKRTASRKARVPK